MKKSYDTPRRELSYYGLSLLSYLRDSHPDKAEDQSFIGTRADEAAQIYSDTIKSGCTHVEAEEAASVLLYRGLHFSAYNTIVNIIWDEFKEEVPEENARALAKKILPLCGSVLTKYDQRDDFADTPQYDLLYIELTGTVAILLEDGLQ